MSDHKLNITKNKQPSKVIVLVVILIFIIASILFVLSACSKNSQSDELNKARQQAIEDLQTYRDGKDNSLYSEINIKMLDDLLIFGKDAINSSLDKQQITDILVKIKFDMDSILTIEASYDEEVKTFALYKIEKNKELNTYRANFIDENYSAENLIELNNILSKFCDLIFMAKTYELVENLVLDAKTAMDSVPNKDNVNKINLSDYKNSAINIITKYRADKDDALYSNEGLRCLDNCFLDCIKSINDALSMAQIDEIVEACKDKLDAVLNSEEEILDYKGKSILQLEQYRATKDNKDYSDEGVQLLDSTLSTFVESIKLAKTILDIESQLNNGKKELDKVCTLAEELEYIKNNAVKNLEDYRNSKIDYYYSADGISSLNTILLNGIISINNALDKISVENALNSAKNALDSIIVADEELVEVKINAINDLHIFRQSKDDDEYTDDAVRVIDKTMENGINSINMAGSIEEVNAALSNAKSIINSVKTFAQAITERKIDKISLLEKYRATKDDKEYTIDGIRQLDETLAEGVLRINSSNSFEEIEEVFAKYKAMLDSVKNSVQELKELKEQSLILLNEYRATKNDSEYTLQGLDLLLKIVTTYEKIICDCDNFNSVNEALLDAKNEMDKVKTYDAELFDAKINAQTELENYRKSKSDELYSVNGIALLNKETNDGVYRISNVRTFEELDQILKSAKYNIDNVPTLADELQMIKDNAINELIEYRNSKNSDEYSANGLLELEAALSCGIDKINCAESENEINILINEIKTSIDLVKTFTIELKESKSNAIRELDAHRKLKNEENYTKNGILQLDKILETGINSINDASSIVDVESILRDSKDSLDKVLTADEEILELKRLAEQDLINYRNLKNDSDFSLESVKLLDAKVKDGIFAINNAISQVEIQSALSNAIAELDAIPTYAEELSEKKSEAIEILNKLRLQKNDNDYSDKAIETMDSALHNGIEMINASTELDEIDNILENSMKTINEVKTKTEEATYLSQFKVDMINKIIAYRETFPIENYSTEGVESLDNILSDAIALINIALNVEEVNAAFNQSVAKMDEVPKYNDELAEAKVNAYSNIKAYRETKSNELYNEQYVLEMDKIVDDALLEINNAIYLDEIEGILDRFMTDLDNIPTILQEAKIDAKNMLIEYREEKEQNEYAQEELQELENIVVDNLALIEGAESIDEINNIILNAKKSLDEVITYSEKVEIAKGFAMQELQDYRSAIDESLYDIESLNKLNSITENGLIEIQDCLTLEDINQVLAKAKSEIDKIEKTA